MKFKVLNVLVAAILCICIASILYLGLIVEHEYLGYDEQGTYHSPSESGSFDSYLAVRAENNTFYLTYKDVFFVNGHYNQTSNPNIYKLHVDDAYLTDQHDIDDQYSSILDGVDSSSFDGQYLIISHKKASVTMDKEIIYFNLIDRDGTIYMINQSIDDE